MIAQARDQSKRSLAAEVLRSGLHLRLRAMGTSMLPTLWPGDLLTIESVAVEQAKRGDLILFMREGRFFVHRLIAKVEADAMLITRGDCLSAGDAPVSAKEFLGKVVQVQRRGLSFAPSPCTTTMIATKIPAAISPYSTAVAPERSRAIRLNAPIIWTPFALCLEPVEVCCGESRNQTER